MSASFLLISSAFLHALWNAFAKKSAYPAIHLTGIMSVAAVFSLLFIPMFPEPPYFEPGALLWAVGAGICEGGYIVALAITLERLPIGPSYTIMRGVAMIVVWMISAGTFSETLQISTLTGILAVLVGLYLSTPPAKKNLSAAATPGFASAYACALFIAGYHLCYDRALEFNANPAALFSLSLWIALPFLYLFAGRARTSVIKHQFVTNAFPLLMGGMISAISFILFLVGLRHSGPGYALTLRNSSIIFAQCFALAIGEPVTRRQWLGALFVAAGATLVAL